MVRFYAAECETIDFICNIWYPCINYTLSDLTKNMGNYNRSSRDRGRSGGGFNKRDGRDGGRPVMHRATCSDCGNNCQVPFKPTGNKPVLCSDCFGGQNGGRRDYDRDRGGRSEKPRFNDRQMHNAICNKCGKNCQVPFKPTGDKPIFCNDCFGKGDGKNKSSNEAVEQIKVLSAKIDKLIMMLAPKKIEEQEEKTKTKIKTTKKTATKKK